ncbi:MAG: hypothetical protein U0872_07245 [Planctomycetaceae bacterium]
MLETFFDPVLQQFPTHREALLASGELALSKHDAELAAELFSTGVKAIPDDADFQFGLARAGRVIATAEQYCAGGGRQGQQAACPGHALAGGVVDRSGTV